MGLNEIKQLAEADANAVFEAMAERARREEDLGAETASLKPMIDMAQGEGRAFDAAHRRGQDAFGEGTTGLGAREYPECLQRKCGGREGVPRNTHYMVKEYRQLSTRQCCQDCPRAY